MTENGTRGRRKNGDFRSNRKDDRRVIVVTGAAGFIGKHLVRELLQRTQDDVIGLDNLHRGDWSQLPANARLTLIEGDVRDAELLQDLLNGSHLVFHLAAKANVMQSEQDPDYAFESNVMGTFNLLRQAYKAGVQHVVFTSSREVYGEANELPVPEMTPLRPKNIYGASKAAAEAYCRMFDRDEFRVSIARLANVYGPGDHDRVIPTFIDRANRGLPLTIYGGRQVVDFVAVQLVIEALWQVSCRPSSEPINVGSGRGVTLSETARRILKATGSPSRLDISPARHQEVVRFVADVTRMRSYLGVEPPDDPLSELDAVLADEHPLLMPTISGEGVR